MKRALFSFRLLLLPVLLLVMNGMSGCHKETADDGETVTANLSGNMSFSMVMEQSVARPGVISDRNGGVIIIYSELVPDDEQIIHIQRINRSGETVWNREIGEASILMGDELSLFSDGNGGVVTYGRITPVGESGFGAETIFRIDSHGDIVYQTAFPMNTSIIQLCPDTSGNVFVSYRKNSVRNSSYLQKISGDGDILWDDGGILLRGDIQHMSLRLVPDDSGGIVVVWHEFTPESTHYGGRYCGQRIDADGNLLWEGQSVIKNGAEFYATDRYIESQQAQAIPTGFGGVEMTWIEHSVTKYAVIKLVLSETCEISVQTRIDLDQDVYEPGSVAFPFISEDSGNTILFWSNATTLYMQKLDQFERPVQDRYEVAAGDDLDSIRIFCDVIPDNSGGYFVMWEYVNAGDVPKRKLRIYKLDEEGSLAWGDDGISIDTPEDSYPSSGDIVSDGEGGVIVTWTTGPLVPNPYSSSWEGKMLISTESYIQRFDADGKPLWGPDGIKLGE